MARNTNLFVVLAALSVAPQTADAQSIQADCGDLPRPLCIMLQEALADWNASFGEELPAIGFRYAGTANPESIYALYQSTSASQVLTLSPETGELRLRSVSDAWEENPDASASVLDRLARYREVFGYQVTITWEFGGEQFETTALLGQSYPYLIDTMIASVIIQVRPEETVKNAFLCDYEEYRIFPGIRVGEYEARFYSTRFRSAVDGTSLECILNQEPNLLLGEYRLGDHSIDYSNGRCKTVAELDYLYPFSSITLTVNDAGIGVERVAGGQRRSKICELP